MRHYIEIISSYFKENILFLKTLYCRVGIVLKANAYGHGDNIISSLANDIEDIIVFISHLEEAKIVENKNFSSRLVIMSPFLEDNQETIKILNKEKIEIVLYGKDSLKKYIVLSSKLSRKINIHIKCDTGMNRLGFSLEELKESMPLIKKHCNVVGVMTHCAETNMYSVDRIKKQVFEFDFFIEEIKKNFPFIESHAFSSGAADCEPQYEIIRCGSFSYGLWKSKDQKKRVQEKINILKIKQIMRWKTFIIQIKEVKKGSFVGYGRTYKAEKNIKIAILPVGYEDGYDRLLSDKSSVVINGKYAPICGLISMSLLTVDITEIECKEGDTVLLTDPNYEKITLDYLGSLLGIQGITFSSRISRDVQRTIVKE